MYIVWTLTFGSVVWTAWRKRWVSFVASKFWSFEVKNGQHHWCRSYGRYGDDWSENKDHFLLAITVTSFWYFLLLWQVIRHVFWQLIQHSLFIEYFCVVSLCWSHQMGLSWVFYDWSWCWCSLTFADVSPEVTSFHLTCPFKVKGVVHDVRAFLSPLTTLTPFVGQLLRICLKIKLISLIMPTYKQLSFCVLTSGSVRMFSKACWHE